MYNYVHIIIQCKNWINNKSNTTGATSGAETAYPSGTHEFTPSLSGVNVIQSLVFCVVFCRSLLYQCLYILSTKLKPNCITTGTSLFTISCKITLEELEQLTLPVHRGFRVAQSLAFCVTFYQTLFFPFVLYLLSIVLFVL